MAGGNSLIKVDDAGASRIHNHGDGETEVRAKRGGRTKLARGIGVKVEDGARAGKPVVLPPTPGWTAGPQIFLGVPGRLSELRGAWASVAEAESYFVELAEDREGLAVLAAVTVAKSAQGFELHGLPSGRYHVRVASVDGDQFESIPSDALTVELREAGREGPGGVAPRWPEDALSPIPQVLPGTALTLPPGVRCGESAEALGARPLYLRAGVHELVCETDEGEAVAAFPVEVPVLAAGFATDASAVELVRGRAETHELRIDAPLELPERLFVEAPAGVEISGVEPGPEPGSCA